MTHSSIEKRNSPKEHRTLTEQEVNAYWSTSLELWVYDFDYLGHLTAAIYPKAFEEARYRYFKDRWETHRPAYVVAHHSLTFTKEILQEVTPIQVLLRPIELSRSRLVLEELLLDSLNRVCNVSQVTLVAWDVEQRASRAFSPQERQAIETDLANFRGVAISNAKHS